MVKTVVILGAGWAGLPLAHKLLKYTCPKARDGLKIILISSNSHFYSNVAAVRGVISGAIPDEQLFQPIEPAFAYYPTENFEFIPGKAEHLDPQKDTIEVARNGGTRRSLSYDQIVIATGSHIRSNLPFKPIGTHEETLEALHSLQKQIGGAKSIVVAGGGPTGVATAGELAAAYSEEKSITLIVDGDHVLQASHVLPSISQIVERDLQKLGVELIRNAQVKETRRGNAETEKDTTVAQTTTVLLSNVSTLTTDLYLPLFGVEVNTGFVPPNLLDSAGNLVLDKTMQVRGR